jgi:hypothetical protein
MERLRYRDEIFAAGFEAVRALGPFHYASLHFRSGDFQMSKIASAEKIAARVSTIVGDKQLLYVATDHRDKKALRRAFAKHGVNIVLWENLVGTQKAHAWDGVLVPARSRTSHIRWAKWVGMIEQVICAEAERFVGSARSTFTAGINRMRLFNGAPVQALLVHNHLPNRDVLDAEAAKSAARSPSRPSRPEVLNPKCPLTDCAPFGD